MRGYTLIELLVVVALIGVLSAVGLPLYTGYVNGAREKEVQATLRSIAAAQEAYRLLIGSYFNVACDDLSATKISESLLSKHALNTTYFNFCASSDTSLTSPNFLVRAINKKTGKQFTIDQDNNELTLNGSIVTVGF
jgi:prepilin-type N-terminal cleavage/methylation domain-containing protein